MNCKNCGAVLNSDDLFCKQCGQPVKNEPTNTNINQYQTQPIQNPNVNSYSNYNGQANQQYNGYNNYDNYNNTSNNGNVGKIILTIILAIVFLVVGWFLGKMIFGGNDSTTNSNDISSISSSNSSNTSTNKDSSKNSSTNSNNSSVTTSEDSSYIVTYNGTKVYFEVKGSLIEDTDYSDEEDRCFDKESGDDYATIWITEDYGTVADYMADVEDDADWRTNNSDYNNIKLSEIKTKTVNGLEFSYRTLDYNMEDTEFHELYIVYEIEEDSLYTIEIEEYQLLSNAELNGLLNITISK